MADTYDVVVVGGGLSGLVAAWQAGRSGLSVALVAATPGSLPHTSGALDLLAVYPTETKRYRSQPWAALSELIERDPTHPYSLVGLRAVRQSVEAFLDYLEAGPLAYQRRADTNMGLITAVGTIKPTYAVPYTMLGGVHAFEQRRPTLILGFEGLTELCPEHVVGSLRNRWPGLRAERLDLGPIIPQGNRISAAMLAAEFEKPAFRHKFVQHLAPRLGQHGFLGLPAVLGFGRATRVVKEMEEQLGVRIFEIPLITPSLPGSRLADLLLADLLETSSVRCFRGAPVVEVKTDNSRRRVTQVVRQGRGHKEELALRHLILASGRFFGGGLKATQQGVHETVLGLDIDAPPCRDDWHMSTFLGAPGHPINRAGVVVDHALRPTDSSGQPLYDNVHVAGALLQNHDWVREKSGAGVCIATGCAAIDAAVRGKTNERQGNTR